METTIDQMLETLKELEDHVGSDLIYIELYSDTSGSVNDLRDKELFCFNDLESFFSESNKFMDKKLVIQVDPSNVMYEDEHFMIVRKEVE